MENSINAEINEERPEEKKKWRTPELKKTSLEDATNGGGWYGGSDGDWYS